MTTSARASPSWSSGQPCPPASPFCWVPPSCPGLTPLLEMGFYPKPPQPSPKPHCWKCSNRGGL
ncbi:unnamed protein product [Prunus armeniaca]